jgi:hypothetical protein
MRRPLAVFSIVFPMVIYPERCRPVANDLLPSLANTELSWGAQGIRRKVRFLTDNSERPGHLWP